MKKVKLLTGYLLIIITVLFISSCVPSKPVEEERILPADRLVKKLEANRRNVKTFSGSGVINVSGPEVTANANFQVELKKPDSIKIAIYGPFGIDLAQALATKQNFQFYDVINNRLYRGRTTNLSLKNIFKVDLTFDELMDAFAGSVNLTDKLRREPDKLDVSNEKYFLTYQDSLVGRSTRYEILVDDLAITNYVIIENPGNVVLEGKYRGFREFEDVPIPYETAINYNLMGQKIDIEYRNISVNKELNDLRFPVPKDAEIIEW